MGKFKSSFRAKVFLSCAGLKEPRKPICKAGLVEVIPSKERFAIEMKLVELTRSHPFLKKRSSKQYKDKLITIVVKLTERPVVYTVTGLLEGYRIYNSMQFPAIDRLEVFFNNKGLQYQKEGSE